MLYFFLLMISLKDVFYNTKIHIKQVNSHRINDIIIKTLIDHKFFEDANGCIEVVEKFFILKNCEFFLNVDFLYTFEKGKVYVEFIVQEHENLETKFFTNYGIKFEDFQPKLIKEINIYNSYEFSEEFIKKISNTFEGDLILLDENSNLNIAKRITDSGFFEGADVFINEVQQQEIKIEIHIKESEIVSRKIKITGNTIFDDKELEKFLNPIKNLKVIKKYHVNSIITNIVGFYYKFGFITNIDYEHNLDVFEIKILEIKVDEVIFVSGNDFGEPLHSKEEFLKNLISVKHGVFLTRQLINNAKKILEKTGFFKNKGGINISYSESNKKDFFNLVCTLEETEQFSLELPSLSIDTKGFVVKGGISHRNLTGRGEQFNFSAHSINAQSEIGISFVMLPYKRFGYNIGISTNKEIFINPFNEIIAIRKIKKNSKTNFNKILTSFGISYKLTENLKSLINLNINYENIYLKNKINNKTAKTMNMNIMRILQRFGLIHDTRNNIHKHTTKGHVIGVVFSFDKKILFETKKTENLLSLEIGGIKVIKIGGPIFAKTRFFVSNILNSGKKILHGDYHFYNRGNKEILYRENKEILSNKKNGYINLEIYAIIIKELDLQFGFFFDYIVYNNFSLGTFISLAFPYLGRINIFAGIPILNKGTTSELKVNYGLNLGDNAIAV